MRITDVEAIYVRIRQVKEQCDSGQDALIVRVTTDEGVIGIGEVDWSRPSAVGESSMGHFRTLCAVVLDNSSSGKFPFKPNISGTKCFAITFILGTPVYCSAISGVDIALWDIKGKKLGMPILETPGVEASQEATLLRQRFSETPGTDLCRGIAAA